MREKKNPHLDETLDVFLSDDADAVPAVKTNWSMSLMQLFAKEDKRSLIIVLAAFVSFSWSETVHADQKRPQSLLVSRTEGKMDGWLDGYGWGMWTDSPP